VLTAIIDSRMNPAAAASKAAMDEYTSELTDEVVKTRPAARKPTIYVEVSMCIPVTGGKSFTYRDMVSSLRIRCDCDGDTDNAKEHEDERPPGEIGEAAADG